MPQDRNTSTPPTRLRAPRWGTYIGAFVITAAIFATALYLNNYFNNRRIEQVRSMEDDVSTDILSLETQFDLLTEHSCSDISDNSELAPELSSLGSQLSYLESQPGGDDNADVASLKNLYTILEIKDIILMKDVAQKCDLQPVFILYFYSNKNGECTDCARQGDVLTELGQEYPQLRVYSFDYDLDLGALQTLKDIDGVSEPLPALVLNGQVYHGFKSVNDIKNLLPELSTLATSTATSTAATSTR